MKTKMQKANIGKTFGEVLSSFRPKDGREAAELAAIRELYAREGRRLLFRETGYAHFTASAILLNKGRDRTLMAYHRIYDSWAWTGGHADGEDDPEAVARREAEEETGITGLVRLGEGAASVEILPVWAHTRRGVCVPSHLHLNVSYLFTADDTLPLAVREEENRAVAWLPCDRLSGYVTEPDMMPIYLRLLKRAEGTGEMPADN